MKKENNKAFLKIIEKASKNWEKSYSCEGELIIVNMSFSLQLHYKFLQDFMKLVKLYRMYLKWIDAIITCMFQEKRVCWDCNLQYVTQSSMMGGRRESSSCALFRNSVKHGLHGVIWKLRCLTGKLKWIFWPN